MSKTITLAVDEWARITKVYSDGEQAQKLRAEQALALVRDWERYAEIAGREYVGWVDAEWDGQDPSDAWDTLIERRKALESAK